ncbi:MAG: hypothetical protein MMC23_004637 [Stictis urceolatum]|nr:hypothetical protein [Stictis urceolata]
MGSTITTTTTTTPRALERVTHPPRLQDRVAIVTGASSGLGREIALAYASHGVKLVVCADLSPEPKLGVDTNTETTHEAISRIYGAERGIFVQTDVGDSESVKNMVVEAARVGGRLDIIVNNAGLGPGDTSVRLHESDDDRWDLVMRVNSRGVYLGCKYAIAQFLKQGLDEKGHRGWIVNVSSMLGMVGIGGGHGAYCASKGASLNLTRQIAVDYAKDRIHCNALCPGFTKTSMTRSNYEDVEIEKMMRDTTPWGEWGVAMEVAKGAVFLASGDAAWVTGVALPVDGGYTAQ